MATIKGRPFRAGRPFRCYRDPSRRYFGFINKIVVSYTDGHEPFSECMSLAEFNRLVGKNERKCHFIARTDS